MKNTSYILIDWLQFTVMNMNHLQATTEILQLENDIFQEIDRGMLGYKDQKTYKNISVLWNGNKDMGVHIIISGQGCRQYETENNLIGLIDRINKVEGKVTRIDLALDDIKGDLIPFEKMLQDIITGNIASRWKTTTEMNKRTTDGEMLGKSIRIGSRTSNTMLRIYDKALEQNLLKIWNRMELEIRKQNAQVLQKKINKNNIGDLMKGILKNYIRFLKPNPGDTNKSRWKNRKYWDKLISNIDKVKLTQKPENKTIEDKKNWIEKQVGQTMALISLIEGDQTFINSIISKNAINLKPNNRKILEQYKGDNDNA